MVTVVGVAPEGLDFPRATEVWTPIRGEYASRSVEGPENDVELHVLARMAPGVDPATVAVDVTTTLAVSLREESAFWVGLEPVVRGFEEHVVGQVRPVLRAGSLAALLLLLAGAANATLFLLARGRTAAHDLAIRKALGAERAQLVGRLVADAGLVCVLGTGGGLGIAWLALRVLVPLAPPELPRMELVALQGGALGFALGVGILSTVLTGAAAGLLLSRPGIRAVVSTGGRGHPGGGARFRMTIAALQVALTVVSAVGAGLLMRTVVAMNRLDPGFSAGDMTTVSLRVPYDWFEVPEAYLTALEELVRDLETRPGIVAARPTLGPPLQQRLEVVLTAEGQSEEEVRENPYVAVDAVLSGHFEALGIPLLAGRGISDLDNRSDADPVVVVDDVFAGAIWPGADAVGKRINGFGHPDTWFTVVGVVAGTRYREYLQPHPRAYYPLRRIGNSPPSALLVRTSGVAPPSVGDLVREAFLRADPQVLVMGEQRMSDALREPTVGRRFAASVLVFFAGATLLLAALGVYGVFTVSVQERTREMGVRRALGAQRANLVRLVLIGTLKVAVVGAVAGLVAALWAGRLVESLLYGVVPTDPGTFVAVLFGSLVMAVTAGLGPALRASATDPVVSLRAE